MGKEVSDHHILVTGGAGFIGSHTVDLLLESNNQVTVLDDFSTGKRENLKRWADCGRLKVIKADVANDIAASLAEHFPGYQDSNPITHIVHLAAQTSVVRSVAELMFDARVNHGGTAQVFEFARAQRVRKVVFASSAAVYGDVESLPVRESSPRRPLSPYGIHKLSGELLAGYHYAVHELPATCFRFFNVYGPRQDPKSPYSGVISIFADRAQSGQDLLVFGDGKQTRDFIYVGDIARTVVETCLTNKGDGGIFNLGTGTETTVNELAELIISISAVTGKERSSIVHKAQRAGEVARSVADISMAKTHLGFIPKMELRDGLRTTLSGPS